MIKNCYCISSVILMLFWSSFLIKTDAYFTPYLYVTVLAFLCFYGNFKKKEKTRLAKGLILFSSGIFSLMVLAANYPMVFEVSYPGTTFRKIYILFLVIILLGGGGTVLLGIFYLF